jgi:hypothetical protein
VTGDREGAVPWWVEFRDWLPWIVRTGRFWAMVAFLTVIYSALRWSDFAPTAGATPGEQALHLLRLWSVLTFVYSMPVAVVVCWLVRIGREPEPTCRR